MFIAILTLLSALSISGVAAYYSIIGLATIFPGAFIPVVLMGSVLEAGKLVCASWLYRNWHVTNRALRIYLFSAVIILSMITSMGIFGFLSKAHLVNDAQSSNNAQQIAIINAQIKSEQDIIDRQEQSMKRTQEFVKTNNNDRIKQLNDRIRQLDREVEAYTKQESSFFNDPVAKGIELKKQQKAERDAIDQELKNLALANQQQSQSNQGNNRAAEQQIAKSQQRIQDLIKQRAPYQSDQVKLDAEIGPIKYIGELFVDLGWVDKVNTGAAVRWVVMIIILVFDPLAVLMLVAANQSITQTFPRLTVKPREFIDLETPDLDTPVINTGKMEEKPKPDPDPVAQWNVMIDQMNKEARRERLVQSAKLEKTVKEWQEKLEKFNAKAPKPEPKNIEIITVKEETKPKDTVTYNIGQTFTTVEKKKEEKTESEKMQDELEPIIHDTVEERIKPNFTEVIEPEVAVKPIAGTLGRVIVDHRGRAVDLPKTDFERKGMLNKLHQEHGKYQDLTPDELKAERDSENRLRFLEEVPITAEEARNHPPITASRMSFFQDYIDDVLRGDTRAENLPPDLAKTIAILLSDYDNPPVVVPQAAGIPDRPIEVVTTEGLKEKFDIEPKTEDRDMTDEELDRLLDGFKQEEPKGEFDIVISGGKKIRVPKQKYVQNEEQNQSGGWSRIKELDLPEPEKNEPDLPKLESTPEEDIVELADEIQVENKLPAEKIAKHRSKMLSDEQYRSKIEQRINDLITKIESGETRLEDLTEEDRKVIIELLNQE